MIDKAFASQSYSRCAITSNAQDDNLTGDLKVKYIHPRLQRFDLDGDGYFTARDLLLMPSKEASIILKRPSLEPI